MLSASTKRPWTRSFSRLGIHRPFAERLRGERHRLLVRPDPQVKFGDDLDAHAVLGDQGTRAAALDLKAQRAHPDRRDGMHDRKNQRAAGQNHLLATDTGPHEDMSFEDRWYSQ